METAEAVGDPSAAEPEGDAAPGSSLPAPLDRPLFRLLYEEDRRGVAEVVASASLAGLVQGLLIAVINAAAGNVEQDGLQGQLMAAFVILLLVYMASRAYSQDMGAALIEGMVRNIRERFVDQLREARFQDVERMERSMVLGVLSRDAEVLASHTPMVLAGFSALIALLFAGAYIAAMSAIAFLATLAVVVAGSVHSLRKLAFVQEQLSRASDTQDTFLAKLDHLLAGYAEVKHGPDLERDLAENHLALATADLELDTLAARLALNSHFVFVQGFIFMLLGTIAFLLPSLAGFDSSRVTHLVAMVLFLLGPITEAVAVISLLAQADVSAARLQALRASPLDLEATDLAAPESRQLEATGDFDAIVAEGLRYDYRDPDGLVTFEMGPVDIELRRGELLFLVGGNGSGKSTLLRTFTGLYEPDSGELTFNGVPVTSRNRALYRARFAPVYADFHLFDRLYGLGDVDPARVQELLETMGIAHKTTYEAGRFSQLSLSTGQRKRLALVVALLEDRPILVFDEVAADQDPEFRQYFYQTLLPELQAAGKTAIVVTHDDRYFHLADRVLHMIDGHFRTEENHGRAS